MFHTEFVRRSVSLLAIILLVWSGIIPTFGKIPPAHAITGNNEIALPHIASSNNWDEIDKHLAEAIKQAYNSSEEYATTELESWQNQLMQKVDDKFLNWYFNYFNQKAMEFGVPFAWVVFKLDSVLKVLRAEDEKNLNAGEIIQKRMIEDFNSKFQELVLNQESEMILKQIIESIGRNYASALSIRLLQIKSQYKIEDIEWERHLSKIAQLIYSTGNSQSSLSIDSFNSNLLTTIFTITTTTIGLKLAANFTAKAGSELAAKAGASVLVKTGAQILDPILIVGFLAWDVWDYNHMVETSKPELHQNISDYLEEVKYSILTSPENSILAALQDVENMFLEAMES
jgi:hypothetical protein